MTTDQNDLARRVDEVFARAAHPTTHPDTLGPHPTNPEPEPVGFHRGARDRLHSARWLAQPCCCGHQRAAHVHYSASTHCSGCACGHYDHLSPAWTIWTVNAVGCAIWAVIVWWVLR